MEVKAKLNGLRMSARKARLVIGVIRGMDVRKAQEQLQFIPKAAAQPILKLLKSAIANAKNNFQLEENNLFVKKIIADQGPVLKRYRARAFGRGATIKKGSAHIEIVLDEKKKSDKKQKTVQGVKSGANENLKIVKTEEIKKDNLDLRKKEISKVKSDQKPMMKLKTIKDKLVHRTGEK